MLALSVVGGWQPQGGAPIAPSRRVAMKLDEGRYMYGEPYAPAGMGREYINDPTARRPLSEYVGASEEMNLVAYFKGEAVEPWDPLDLCLLSKVSANNPDVAFLREAELKHGRIAMLAFVGIAITSGGAHIPGVAFEKATSVGWPDSLGAIAKSNPGIVAQAVATIGIIEGSSNTQRGPWWGKVD
uniref:Uncharacterized protein n=1 Tax=Calcidiscus leptoporus TaxID=127549 RepID=A0A7S0J1E7_9EUKA|mmetsp:Transcript_34055/g.79759  ORF Transcript_34055/g.79759 Transcript_34055/m.79759 type:complete len:185 (+) Transcript_34055:44-598(+)